MYLNSKFLSNLIKKRILKLSRNFWMFDQVDSSLTLLIGIVILFVVLFLCLLGYCLKRIKVHSLMTSSLDQSNPQPILNQQNDNFNLDNYNNSNFFRQLSDNVSNYENAFYNSVLVVSEKTHDIKEENLPSYEECMNKR